MLPLASRSNLPAGGQFKRSAALVAAHPVAALSAFALAAIPCIIAVWMPGGLFFVIFFWGLLFAGCSSWLTAVLMRQQRVFADPLVTVDEAPTAARR